MAISAVRIQVDLPVRGGNKAKCDSLNVKWIGSFEGNPFLVKAELPSGWFVREKAATDFDQRDFKVLDSDHAVRAEFLIKTSIYDPYAMVTIISNPKAEAPKEGQKEFDRLLGNYNSAVRTTLGTGPRGQAQIDKAYEDLSTFVATHEAFRSDVPKRKYLCSDDGANGLSGLLLTLASMTGNYKA